MNAHHIHAEVPDAVIRGANRPPAAQVISVIAVVFRRGAGCCDKDPVREVRGYYAEDGTLLAENDPVSA